MLKVTDEGAAALGAVLAGRMGLRSVDLRGNRVSKQVHSVTNLVALITN